MAMQPSLLPHPGLRPHHTTAPQYVFIATAICIHCERNNKQHQGSNSSSTADRPAERGREAAARQASTPNAFASTPLSTSHWQLKHFWLDAVDRIPMRRDQDYWPRCTGFLPIVFTASWYALLVGGEGASPLATTRIER